ncbi:MAG: ribonuclease R family protein, partial [Myxococcota bacterium]
MSLPLDRDAILAAFQLVPERPLKAKDVARFLELSADERAEVRAMLYVLVDEGDLVQLPRRRFQLAASPKALPGRVSRTARGFGWFIPDDGANPDGFLPAETLAGLFDGDRVEAVLETSPRGPVARVTKVLSRAKTLVTGELKRRGGASWVECAREVLGTPIMIPEGEEGGAEAIRDGTIVEVAITQYPTHVTSALGRVVRAIGRAGALAVEIDRILTEAGVPRVFSPETLDLAASLPAVPSAGDIEGREDLREVPLCTIDGETAKDFDDAVYGRMEGRDYVVVVAIADVSHYVTPGSALDEDASIRGTSVYYPGSVIPMLPEALSNGLCSLNPGVERLCMCAELIISPRGQCKRSRFFEGVMHSHARLTYTKAWAYLDGDKQAAASIPPEVQRSLDVLRKAARALRAARERRGSMDFELPETVIEVDESGSPRRLYPLERNEAHKLIEDLMLAANEAVAARFTERGLPAIYRIHEPPNSEKVERFLRLARVLAREQGVRPPPEEKGKVPSSKDIRGILEPLHDSPLRRVLDFLLLRAMMQARYSSDNVGHYSLASDAYTHFTSPIRRYPDLVVHRLLREHIRHPRHRPKGEEHEAKTNLLEESA